MSTTTIDRSNFHRTKQPCRHEAQKGRCWRGNKCGFLHIKDPKAHSVFKICKYGIDCINEKCFRFHPDGQKFYNRKSFVHYQRELTSSDFIATAVSSPSSAAAFDSSPPSTQRRGSQSAPLDPLDHSDDECPLWADKESVELPEWAKGSYPAEPALIAAIEEAIAQDASKNL